MIEEKGLPETVKVSYAEMIEQLDRQATQSREIISWYEVVAQAQKLGDSRDWPGVVKLLKPRLAGPPNKTITPLFELSCLAKAYEKLSKLEEVGDVYEWALKHDVRLQARAGGKEAEPVNGFLFAFVPEAAMPDALRLVLLERGKRADPARKEFYALEAARRLIAGGDAAGAQRQLSEAPGATAADSLSLARLWLDKGDTRRAKNAVSVGLRAHPNDASLKALQNASSDEGGGFEQARAAYLSGNRDAARVILERLLKKEPENPKYLYWLGKAGDGKLAYDSFKALLEALEPEMAEALLAEYDRNNSTYYAPFDVAFADVGKSVWAEPDGMRAHQFAPHLFPNPRRSGFQAPPEEFLYLLAYFTAAAWSNPEWREVARDARPEWAGRLYARAVELEAGAERRERYRWGLDVLDASNAYLIVQRVEEPWRQRHWSAVIDGLKSAAALGTNLAVDEYMLGRAHLARGEAAPALEHLEKALRKKTAALPCDPFRGKGLDGIAQHIGIDPLFMHDAFAREDEAWRMRDRLKTSDIQASLAEALLESGQVAQARGLAGKVAAGAQGEQAAWAEAFIGACDLALGEPDKAKARLKAGEGLNKEHPGVLTLAGQLALQEARYDDAIPVFYRALERGKEGSELELSIRERARVQNAVGMAFYHKGVYDLAIESFLRAGAADPNSSSARSNLAAAYLKKGESTKAMDLLYKALGVNPDDEVAKYLLERVSQKIPSQEVRRPSAAGSRWAVMGLTSRGGTVPRAGLDEMASDMLISALFARGDLTIIERKAIEAVLQEHRLGVSELADPNTAIRLGKILTASALVLGNVAESEGHFDLDLRVVSVKTGALSKAVSLRAEKKDGLRKAMQELAGRLK